MNFPQAQVRRRQASETLAKRALKAALRVDWREVAAVAGGILVLLITSWLIWAALAEAATALAQTV